MYANDHRELDEELRESQSLYRSVVENTSAIILRVSPCAVITFANRRALDFFGYSADELIGRPAIGTIVPPQETTGRDLAKMIDEIALNPDHFRSNANENICKDGRRVWVEWTNSGIYDGEGKLREFLAVGIDATDRRRAEESEQRLMALMNHNPSLIFLKDEWGRYVYLNESYERQFALTKDWQGKTDFDFWGKESALLFRANDAEVLRSGKTQQFLEDSTDKAGRRFCWLCYKFPFTDSRGARYVGGVGIDATARVFAEEALRGSELRYRTLINATSAVTWSCPPSGLQVEPQPEWMAFTGQSVEEMLGDGWTKAIHPEDLPDVAAKWQDAVARGEPYANENRIRRHDGQWRWMSVRIAPVRDRNGSIVEWFGMNVDITDRKLAEQQLAASLKDLHQAQEELVRQERLATLGKLAGSVAHEMRTPLTVIRSSLFFLERCYPTGDRDVREALGEVKRAIVSSDHIISEMLDYVRGTGPCDAVFCLDTAIAQAVRSVPVPPTIRIQDSSIEGAAGMMVRGNPDQITRILVNLIQNAVQAMPAGGELEIRAGWDGADRIFVSIRDTGCGIPAENLPKIFEPLFSTKTVGIGLGLAIAKRYAELNGCELSVESEPGRGTTFNLSLKSGDHP